MINRGAAIYPTFRKCRRCLRKYGAAGAIGFSAVAPGVAYAQWIACLHECDPAAQTLSGNFDIENAGTALIR
jgi:hypothetical protein